MHMPLHKIICQHKSQKYQGLPSNQLLLQILQQHLCLVGMI